MWLLLVRNEDGENGEFGIRADLQQTLQSIKETAYSFFVLRASTHYTIKAIHYSYIFLSLVHHILDHIGANYVLNEEKEQTRNIEEQPEERYSIIVKSKVPSIRKRHRENVTRLDERKTRKNHKDLTRDSSRIQNVEEVVSEEKKPCRHRNIQCLNNVEEIPRNLH